MKPNDKQISDLQAAMSAACMAKGLSYAEVGRLTNVDQAQVSRIVRGQFKRFSSNVIQICRVLGVELPVPLPKAPDEGEWTAAFSSVQRLINQSADNGTTVSRLLNAIADLQSISGSDAHQRKTTSVAE